MFEGVPQEVIELLLNECSHQGASVTEVAVGYTFTVCRKLFIGYMYTYM